MANIRRGQYYPPEPQAYNPYMGLDMPTLSPNVIKWVVVPVATATVLTIATKIVKRRKARRKKRR